MKTDGNGRVPGEGDGTEDGWVVVLPAPDTAPDTAPEPETVPAPETARPTRKQVATDLSLIIVVILFAMALGALALSAWLGLVSVPKHVGGLQLHGGRAGPSQWAIAEELCTEICTGICMEAEMSLNGTHRPIFLAGWGCRAARRWTAQLGT
jgi:hypothetical protein